jgi:NADH:ubiquinone oxidoreductase subunit C
MIYKNNHNFISWEKKHTWMEEYKSHPTKSLQSINLRFFFQAKEKKEKNRRLGEKRSFFSFELAEEGAKDACIQMNNGRKATGNDTMFLEYYLDILKFFVHTIVLKKNSTMLKLIEKNHLTSLLKILKYSSLFRFDFLNHITAQDKLALESRFLLYYILRSLSYNHQIIIELPIYSSDSGYEPLTKKPMEGKVASPWEKNSAPTLPFRRVPSEGCFGFVAVRESKGKLWPMRRHPAFGKNDFSCESITFLYISADWFEREVFDMFGIFFMNHKDLRRILTDYGFKHNPLRKDFPLIGFKEIRYDDSIKSLLSETIELVQIRH